MNTTDTALTIGGAAAVVLAFVIKSLAGKIVKRWPSLSPLVRAVLHALPNLISGLLALLQGKPAEAPLAEPRDVLEQAKFLYAAYVEAHTTTYRDSPLPAWEALNPSEAERWQSVARASLGQPEPPKPATGATALLLASLVLVSCTPQQARTAGQIFSVVGKEICSVLDDQSDEVWVALACRAVETTGTVLSNMSASERLDASRPTTAGPTVIRMVKREDLHEYTLDRTVDQ